MTNLYTARKTPFHSGTPWTNNSTAPSTGDPTAPWTGDPTAPWTGDPTAQAADPSLPDQDAFALLANSGAAAAKAAAPIAVKASPTALYLQEPGDTAAISVNDINQGQLGDCFLLSAIGEIALLRPSFIMNMIVANADGTETVTLHNASQINQPGDGTTAVTVTNVFPGYAVNNGASQDVFNGQKEIWVQVLEKAVATLNGGYNVITGGGYPFIAMEQLTGVQANWMDPSSLSLAALQSDQAAGDLITIDTPSVASLPYNLVSDHAYMFQGLTTVNGISLVQLRNPWGYDNPGLIPFSLLAQDFDEVDVGSLPAAPAPVPVPAPVPLVTPTISGTVAGQAISGQQSVSPFSLVTITDPNVGQIDTVTVLLSTPANGGLSNLGGGSYSANTGVYSDTGSAAVVTADLDGLVFTPKVVTGRVTTGFTIKVSDTAGAATSNSTTTVLTTATTTVVATGATLSVNTAQSMAVLVDDGTVSIGNGGSLDVTSALDPSSSGIFQLQNRASLELASATGASVKVQFLGASPAGKLILDNTSSFGGHTGTTAFAGVLLENFGNSDSVDLRGLSSWITGANYSGGLLQLFGLNRTAVAALHFQDATLGNGGPAARWFPFAVTGDGAGGVLIKYV